MKAVKVYDIKTYVESESKGEYTSHRREDSKIAILEGEHGILVTCDEGVSWIFNTLDKEYTANVCKVRAKGYLALSPDAQTKIPLAEIKEKCTFEEVELGEFVRHFGSRIEQNYRELMKGVKEIGLDPKDYPREDRTR